MSYGKPLSLSLQKEIERRNLSLDSELQKTLTALKVRSLLDGCGMVMHSFYPSEKCLLELFGVHARKDPGEGVVTGNAVR
jgi:hypothetical protein